MSEHEKTRYSDEELLEFKKIILDKLEKAKADYDLLRSTITHTSSNDIEDTSPTFKVLEEGAATLSKRSRAGWPSGLQVHPAPRGGIGAHREQVLRYLPRDG